MIVSYLRPEEPLIAASAALGLMPCLPSASSAAVRTNAQRAAMQQRATVCHIGGARAMQHARARVEVQGTRSTRHGRANGGQGREGAFHAEHEMRCVEQVIHRLQKTNKPQPSFHGPRQ